MTLTNRSGERGIVLRLALLLSLSPLLGAHAQGGRRPPVLSLLAGPATYDLEGTGTGFTGALRVAIPSGRILVFDLGVNYFRYRAASGNRIEYLMPEASFQVQAPSRFVHPYVGVGLGEAEFLSGRGSSDFTVHAAAGVRLDLVSGWGLGGEVRARSIRPFSGETLDFTAGVSRRLR